MSVPMYSVLCVHDLKEGPSEIRSHASIFVITRTVTVSTRKILQLLVKMGFAINSILKRRRGCICEQGFKDQDA